MVVILILNVRVAGGIMKILRESFHQGFDDKENDYARRLREVEELMTKNEVRIFSRGELFVGIKDKEFHVRNTSTFPRMVDDEVLEVWD
jgi:hypothetical protein